MSGNVTQFVSAERLFKMRGRFDDAEARALRSGEHLWVAVVSYFVTPPIRDGQLLDVENMAIEPAVGCYLCEQPFTTRLASRRCKAKP